MPATSHTLIIPVRRRRSTVADPLKKMTLQLSQSVVAQIKKLVDAGEAASANVFVEDAIRARLRELRRTQVYAAYEEAARDPKYLADLNADMNAFDPTLSDESRG